MVRLIFRGRLFLVEQVGGPIVRPLEVCFLCFLVDNLRHLRLNVDLSALGEADLIDGRSEFVTSHNGDGGTFIVVVVGILAADLLEVGDEHITLQVDDAGGLEASGAVGVNEVDVVSVQIHVLLEFGHTGFVIGADFEQMFEHRVVHETMARNLAQSERIGFERNLILGIFAFGIIFVHLSESFESDGANSGERTGLNPCREIRVVIVTDVLGLLGADREGYLIQNQDFGRRKI